MYTGVTICGMRLLRELNICWRRVEMSFSCRMEGNRSFEMRLQMDLGGCRIHLRIILFQLVGTHIAASENMTFL